MKHHSRYEPIELEGTWYVFDSHHPDTAPVERKDADDAKVSAMLWNLVSAPTTL
jgi:hypothetical protein